MILIVMQGRTKVEVGRRAPAVTPCCGINIENPPVAESIIANEKGAYTESIDISPELIQICYINPVILTVS